MSTPIPNRYPVDYTGVKPSNKISHELVDLSGQANSSFRVFSPVQAPYFDKNIVLVDAATGLTLLQNQYRCYQLVTTPTAIAGPGNNIYSIVVITDASVGNLLSATYQTVGGGYTTGYESIALMITNLANTNQVQNTDPVSWDVLRNLPEGFTQTLHLHSLSDTVGWEYVASQLEQLRVAILLGDHINKAFVLSYIDRAAVSLAQAQIRLTQPGTPFGDHVIDTTNPHAVTAEQLGLGNVQNYPIATLAQVFAGSSASAYVTADQVALAVKNEVNGGVDAHILDTGNPHQVNRAQLGLGNVQNYPIASIDELRNPVVGDQRYVTNTIMKAWLLEYFETAFGADHATLATVLAHADQAITNALIAQEHALAAHTEVVSSVATVAQSLAQANAAHLIAVQNALSATSSGSEANTLVQTYVAQSVAAAHARGYSEGFSAGQLSP